MFCYPPSYCRSIRLFRAPNQASARLNGVRHNTVGGVGNRNTPTNTKVATRITIVPTPYAMSPLDAGPL
jgi:hypothetical protein